MEPVKENLIRANVLSARDLGWRPIEFGALGFDEDLIDAVASFQSERLLRATGVVDTRTYRALVTWRGAIEETAEDREQERLKAEFGAGRGKVPWYAPAHSYIWPFTRRFVVLSNRSEFPSLSMAIHNRRIGSVVIAHNASEWALCADVARQSANVSIAMVASRSDAIRALLRDRRFDAVLVRFDLQSRQSAARSLMVVEYVRAIAPRKPVGIVYHQRLAMNLGGAAEWLHRATEMADVYVPYINPISSPEYTIQFAVASVLARTDLAGVVSTFPMLDARASDNFIYRARDTLLRLGIRGYGYGAVPVDRGNGPYYGKIKSVKRLDGGRHGTGDTTKYSLGYRWNTHRRGRSDLDPDWCGDRGEGYSSRYVQGQR